jgi:hypothetical protein
MRRSLRHPNSSLPEGSVVVGFLALTTSDPVSDDGGLKND